MGLVAMHISTLSPGTFLSLAACFLISAVWAATDTLASFGVTGVSGEVTVT